MAAATSTTAPPDGLNVAERLARTAAIMPHALAVACPHRWSPSYRCVQPKARGGNYAVATFAELDADATRIARGLVAWGVPPGSRLVLLVRPGIEFITLVFALLRAGMTVVLVDPGLGRRNLIRCLAEAEPDGFIAIPMAHAVRTFLRRKFPRAEWNVTVGRRWFWGGATLEQLRALGAAFNSRDAKSSPTTAADCPPATGWDRGCSDALATAADGPAAIIFTSGSTGPPKGVLYTHRMFDAQVDEIRSEYEIEPGGTDLACFPLFALFNAAMGVTTVLPEMDFSRPATADPCKLLRAAHDWSVTQAFASPAVWRVLSGHCERTGERMPSLRQVFSCGAPVAAEVLRSTLACAAPGARMHTPYGATECLPVATIEAGEVLGETAPRTAEGAGVCVGRKFDSIDWRIIRIMDVPIATIQDAEELPPGEVGELVVRGPQASPRYVTRLDANASAKILAERAGASPPSAGAKHAPPLVGDEHENIWHRMGDLGYLDEQGRFWYCGRKSQCVETQFGPLYTECVEAVFNRHPQVKRSALVGIGPRPVQIPVIIVEFYPGLNKLGWAARYDRIKHWKRAQQELLQIAKSHPALQHIRFFLRRDELPVDIRHNAKINREKLTAWATRRLRTTHGPLAPDS